MVVVLQTWLTRSGASSWGSKTSFLPQNFDDDGDKNHDDDDDGDDDDDDDDVVGDWGVKGLKPKAKDLNRT